jgi:hypothetical protein
MMTPHQKTPATRYLSHDAMWEGPAGSFMIDDKGLCFTCPCGCDDTRQIDFPRWSWDGNKAEPTIEPSIRCLSGCMWHGYLTHGIWTPCADSGAMPG